MWKLEIVKSTKQEVVGTCVKTHTQHLIDCSRLKRRPFKKEFVTGFKTGGSIIAASITPDNL